MAHTDTIAAQATPPGQGGVGIIRLSGALVTTLMRNIIGSDLPARVAKHVPFLDDNQQPIDVGIAIFFPAPHSFTGEDVLELHAHGGPIIIDMLLQRALTLGARIARPGEFSERAFLNDKLDLTQAEAIADLIQASSEQAARLAVRSLQGDFSKKIHALVTAIIHLRMYVEASIDFAEEDIDFLADDKVEQALKTIMTDLRSIQEHAQQGSLLRDGIQVVIAGKPNVGKSSLLNCLSGKELAIVTDIPGTTRDVLRNHILIDGMPIHIVDTAGLRESTDVVEREGIRRAHDEIKQADIMLFVIDAAETIISPPDIPSKQVIIVRNKIDLTQEQPRISDDEGVTVVHLSVKNNVGIDLLRTTIKTKAGYHTHTQGQFLARRRHLTALTHAAEHLTHGHANLHNKLAGELLAEDLRQAQLALNEITGEFTTEDLLGEIFASFCVGK